MRTPLLLAACLVLGSCAQYQAGVKNPLIRVSYDAADQLLALAKPAIPKDAPLIAATFVNIDHLTHSSTLGRMLAEQVAARFTQQGYAMVELKLRDSVFVQEGRGELLLSREVRDLSLAHNVQAVVVGSYAVTPEKIFLNIKIVRPQDNRVLSAHNIAVSVDETTQTLLLSEPS
ncbi:FlgO family outer membrane protein [Chitinimonas sp. BJYL2]|uniref:FlgO family outer membrane protein n=1 Tax=Chitinimonas sp. BJYL2 TaxID=2976696 RepID=UPI0022B50125|nr:FlgO family outer membrane protein [Chitinimonas sp. BJYL2]